METTITKKKTHPNMVSSLTAVRESDTDQITLKTNVKLLVTVILQHHEGKSQGAHTGACPLTEGFEGKGVLRPGSRI